MYGLRDLDAMRDAFRRVLQNVFDARAKPRTIANRLLDLFAGVRADDNRQCR